MILCAAVKFYIEKTDKKVVLCGQRHGDIFQQLEALGFSPKTGYKELAQGFITHTGEFLDRAQAFDHALICGQLSSRVLSTIDYGEIVPLCSEDLY